MSSHNGNGAGGGAVSYKRLQKLIAYHDSRAAALRTALELLTEDAFGKVQQRAPLVLAEAMALDAARKRKPAKKRHRDQSKGSKLKQRKASATFLARFDRVTPRQIGSTGMGSLVRRGYLAKSGDGYVRTDKPYDIRAR